MSNYYSVGTVTVTKGSTAVVGVGTSWSSFGSSGLYFWGNGYTKYYRYTVVDNTHITLADPWGGETLTTMPYALMSPLDILFVGGPGTSTQPANTSKSLDHVELLLGISEGPIGGPTNGLKNLHFGDTPVQQSDGTLAFKDVIIDFIDGASPPVAVVMGLGGTSSPVGSPAAPLYSNVAINRTTVGHNIDALDVRIIVNNLQNQGKATALEFDLEYKAHSSGTWLPFAGSKSKVINALIQAPTAYQYRQPVARLASDTYDVRIKKTSAESTSKLFHDCSYESIQEITTGSNTYPDTALLHVQAQASNQFTGVPPIWNLYGGILCHVPSNFNVTTRTYTGVWDGTFVMAVTDDPVWILYELVMNSRWGFNKYYACSIDKYDCYDASVWTSGAVSDGSGGFQPRYTWNGVVQNPIMGMDLANLIAGSFNARCFDDQNGTIILRVDKPASAVALFTQENVTDGIFNYSYSDLNQRYNDLTVSFPNPNLNYEQDRRGIQDTASIAAIGPVPLDFQMDDCNNLQEAIRRGYFRLISTTTEVEQVSFRTNRMGQVVEPFDVILISDPDMGYAASGRVKTISGDRKTITFRDQIYLENGFTYDMYFETPTGTKYKTKAISSTGYVTSITSSTVFPPGTAVDTPFTIGLVGTQVGLHKPYRVLSVKVIDGDPDNVEIVAIEVNINKYSASDAATLADVINYSDHRISTQTAAPTDLTITGTRFNALGVTHNKLDIVFEESPDEALARYRIEYTFNGGSPQLLTEVVNPAAVFMDPPAGDYVFYVYGLNSLSFPSPALIGVYTVDAGDVSTPSRVTGLEIFGKGTDYGFSTGDVKFAWRLNSTTTTLDLDDEEALGGAESGTMDSTFQDYLIQFIDVNTGVVFFQDNTTNPFYSFSYAQNYASTGGPRRTFKVSVTYRDVAGVLSDPTSIIVANAAPVAVTGITTEVGPGMGTVIWPFALEPDVKGFRVYEGSSGFTPGPGNLVYDGTNTRWSDTTHPGTTQYVRIAAYDVFDTTLNYSAEIALSVPAISVGYLADGSVSITKFASGITPVEVLGTLPVTGNFDGRQVFLTTDKKLYRYSSTAVAFIATVATGDLTGTISNGQIANNAIDVTKFASGLTPVEILGALPGSSNYDGRMVFLTTDKKLYRYNATTVAFVKSTDGADILANSITAGQIQAGAITATELAANAITASKIAVFAGANLLADPLCVDAAEWTLSATGVTFASVSGNITSNLGAPRGFAFSGGGRALNEITTAVPSDIAVEELKYYRLFLKTRILSTFTGRLRMSLTWLDQAGATISTTDLLGLDRRAGTAGNATTQLESIVQAPALAVTATPTLACDWSGSITNAGNGYMALPKIMRADAGELTVDGTITGTKIAALTITAANLVADTITAGQIAAGAINTSELAANAVTAAKLSIGPIGLTVSNLNFRPNNPVANQVSWSAGTISYIDSSGTLATASISSGNTGTWASGVIYIYFAPATSTTVLQTTTTAATAFATGNTVLAWYGGGLVLDATYGRTWIDGSFINAGTIVAANIMVGTITANEISVGGVTTTRLATAAATNTVYSTTDTFTQQVVNAGRQLATLELPTSTNDGSPVQIDSSGYLELARSSGSVDGHFVIRVYRSTNASKVTGIYANDAATFNMDPGTTPSIAAFASSADSWTALNSSTLTTNANYLQVQKSYTNTGGQSVGGLQKASMSLAWTKMYIRTSIAQPSGLNTTYCRVTFGATVVFSGQLQSSTNSVTETDYFVTLTSPPGGTGTIKIEIANDLSNPGLGAATANQTFLIDELVFGMASSEVSMISEQFIAKTSGANTLYESFSFTCIDPTPPTSGTNAYLAYVLVAAYVKDISDTHARSSWYGVPNQILFRNYAAVLNQIKR